MASAEEIMQKMRALQETREAAIKPLVDVMSEKAELLSALAALEPKYGKAYVDAEAAGWSPAELSTLGADEPVRKPRKRSRSAGKKSSSPSTGGAPAGSIPPQEDPTQVDTSMSDIG
ncbi:hypothetical protein AB0D00_26315 [Streptomyces sp. NPDC048213]|uniref:hypothetical protein n=1 Tax=Streptomyces sp. NPDC048213 TaxID=3160984 RepID=UPI0033E4BA70